GDRDVEGVEALEQSRGRILQQHRGELVGADRGHEPAPDSGNRCGEVLAPSQPSKLKCTRPSSPRKVFCSPGSALWGPAPPMPGPPSVSRLQNICSCWLSSRPAS